MEATLRPYDRGEEVTPFATLGLYHALPCPRALPSYAYPLCFAVPILPAMEGRRGRSKNEFRKERLSVEPRQRHTRPASTHKCEPTRSLAGSLSPPRMAGFGYCVPGAKNPDGRGPFHVSLGSEMLPLSWGAHPLKEHAGGTHGLKY